jgi:DNA-binding transcriptional regulator YiaG
MTGSGLDYLRQRISENDAFPNAQQCREIRERCGLTVADMATAMNVTGAAVRQWERGERQPRGALRAQYVEIINGLRADLDLRP